MVRHGSLRKKQLSCTGRKVRIIGSRRLQIRTGDLLVVKGFELQAEVLEQIINPDNRVLWAFVRNDHGDLQPVPYDESRVVWLADDDIIRRNGDEV